MNLARLKKNPWIEIISEKELSDLHARECEENFDFEDIKKFVKFNEKLAK